jgi:hypothetical protein
MACNNSLRVNPLQDFFMVAVLHEFFVIDPTTSLNSFHFYFVYLSSFNLI